VCALSVINDSGDSLNTTELNVKLICPNCPHILYSISFFEDAKLSPACPSDHSGKCIKISMEHWRNGIHTGKPKFWKTTCPIGTLSTTRLTVV
jgi:hypothetical protein